MTLRGFCVRALLSLKLEALALAQAPPSAVPTGSMLSTSMTLHVV